MKSVTEKEILNEVDSLIDSVKNDWSKFGDLSELSRSSLIRRLRRIKMMIRMSRRIEFSTKKRSTI